MTAILPYLTAKEAAEEIGLSYARVRKLLKQGRVSGAVKPQRDWMIPTPVIITPPPRKQA